MSSPNPQVIATVTGDGFETCYVSFKSVIASDGPLLTTPTVSTEHTDKITIADEAITAEGWREGVEYAAGEILTFTVTRVAGVGLVPIDVDYETAQRKETLRVMVRLAEWAT